jgi:hypothetical protein
MIFTTSLFKTKIYQLHSHDAANTTAADDDNDDDSLSVE